MAVVVSDTSPIRALAHLQLLHVLLAEEIHADAVLMDEAAGRNVASRMGLAVVGTLGILLRAKQRGMCGELRPLLEQLQQQLHFHIAPALRGRILHESGEPHDA